MRQHIRIWSAALLGSFIALFAAVSSTWATRSEPALSLGGHTLGEGLGNFKAKFPNVICKSPPQAAPNPGKYSAAPNHQPTESDTGHEGWRRIPVEKYRIAAWKEIRS